ncbi:MAG: STAS domain-containing protein [Lachnospiraceae bacterium]|nr:STAS domain-containing protein [Lachnospiraceae bacterium]
MSIKSTFTNNTVTIFLERKIDAGNADNLKNDYFEVRKTYPEGSMVLDASKLTYISSAGLRTILSIKKLEDDFSITNVTPEVYDIFDVTGFSEMFNIRKVIREVSLEKAEFLWDSINCKIYKSGPENLIKVYNPNITIDQVEKERKLTQKAMIDGVPTIISFDIVKCNSSYGLIYELINSKSISTMISENPDSVTATAKECASLLKQMHEVKPETKDFPLAKNAFIKWIDTLDKILKPKDINVIKTYIKGLPDGDSFINGEFYGKNIMSSDGELCVFNLEKATIGHPIFDLAPMYFLHLLLPRFPELYKKHAKTARLILPMGTYNDVMKIAKLNPTDILGFDYTLAPKFYNQLVISYFGLKTPEELTHINEIVKPLATLVLTYYATELANTMNLKVENIANVFIQKWVLPALKKAKPVDF